MILPGQTSQTRWPNKRHQHHHHHNQHKHQKRQHQMNKKSSSSSLANQPATASSSAPELVETFGVPANITPKSSSSFYHQNQQIQKYSTSANSIQLPGAAGGKESSDVAMATDDAQGKGPESFESTFQLILLPVTFQLLQLLPTTFRRD